MASYPRSMLQVAVTTAIAAMLWTAAPAPTAATPVAAAPPVVKREAPRATRTSSSYYDRRTAPIRFTPVHANPECSGFSCGQFIVVMLGVGY